MPIPPAWSGLRAANAEIVDHRLKLLLDRFGAIGEIKNSPLFDIGEGLKRLFPDSRAGAARRFNAKEVLIYADATGTTRHCHSLGTAPSRPGPGGFGPGRKRSTRATLLLARDPQRGSCRK